MSLNEYDSGEHNKTVYAHFGLAMFCAQCLEHEIVNTLSLLELIPRRATVRTHAEWETAVDSIMDNNFEHTLGKMIKDLRQIATVPPTVDAMLAEALRVRNWLAHDYFRERVSEFATEMGRDLMISELEQAQGKFQLADRTLHAAFCDVRARFKITDESIQKLADQMLAEIKSGHNTTPIMPPPWATTFNPTA